MKAEITPLGLVSHCLKNIMMFIDSILLWFMEEKGTLMWEKESRFAGFDDFILKIQIFLNRCF